MCMPSAAMPMIHLLQSLIILDGKLYWSNGSANNPRKVQQCTTPYIQLIHTVPDVAGPNTILVPQALTIIDIYT